MRLQSADDPGQCALHTNERGTVVILISSLGKPLAGSKLRHMPSRRKASYMKRSILALLVSFGKE